MYKFPERLAELRSERNLSQAALAEATGLSKSAIGDWEISKTSPSVFALIKLAEFFGVTTDYLLGVREY